MRSLIAVTTAVALVAAEVPSLPALAQSAATPAVAEAAEVAAAKNPEATQAVAEVASLIISPERSPPERVHTSQELHPIDYKTEGEILCETNLFTFEQTCSGF